MMEVIQMLGVLVMYLSFVVIQYIWGSSKSVESRFRYLNDCIETGGSFTLKVMGNLFHILLKCVRIVWFHLS